MKAILFLILLLGFSCKRECADPFDYSQTLRILSILDNVPTKEVTRSPMIRGYVWLTYTSGSCEISTTPLDDELVFINNCPYRILGKDNIKRFNLIKHRWNSYTLTGITTDPIDNAERIIKPDQNKN